MKDFSNASFPPETIAIMKVALDSAVASLPDPVSFRACPGHCGNDSSHREGRRARSRYIAENGNDGASDPDTLLMPVRSEDFRSAIRRKERLFVAGFGACSRGLDVPTERVECL
jgi:hypothetical protein